MIVFRDPVPLILCTDMGTDVDDAWGLTTALALEKRRLISLQGITTVSGKTVIRGSIALRLLEQAGRSDIPVAIGEEEPMVGGPPPLWEGHEGRKILRFDGTDPIYFHPQRAPQFILQKSLEYANLLLLAIGPLTNIARAIENDPAFTRRLRGIVLMGGGYSSFNNRREHNFRSDPQAAEIVLRSGIPIKMVGHNVTRQCRFSWKEFDQMTQIPKQLVSTLRGLTKVYLKVKARDHTWLHDPLAVVAAVHPQLVAFQTTQIYVNPRGTTTPVSMLKTPPAWSAEVEMAQKVSVREFKGFLKPLLHEYFQALPDAVLPVDL